MTTEKKVTLWIDGVKVTVPEKSTVLQAAQSINIDVPSLCYHPDLSVLGACRVCLVEVEGQRNPVASCSYPVSEGMKVKTSSTLLRRLRRDVVELILDNHPMDCQTCVRNGTCELQKLAYDLGVRERLFQGERKHFEVDKSSPVHRNPDKCILCGRCIRVCGEVQGVNNRLQLAELERQHQRNIADQLMTDGATLADPSRIDVRGHVLAGATAPGVPFLVIGHNGRIAWTFTTTGADVQDLFIETPVGAGQYQTPDGPKPFLLREERIRVRGQDDTVLTVRETRHGPVISDLDHPDGPVLAVAMGNLQPNDSAAAGLLALNRAGSVAEAGAAAAVISSPVQNLLVADPKTIGLFVTGRVPIRAAGDGSAPVPGDGSHDWTGWASGEQLPHSVAPASGRLVNANEPVWPADFPVFMARDTFGAWRADRIRQMLDASNRHTVAGFATMQTDVADMFARKVLPTILAVPNLPENAVAPLRGWDGTAVMDSPAPLIFTTWMQAFYAAVLHRAGLTAGLGTPVSDFVASVLLPDGAHWCGGDCAPLLRDSLTTAAQTLAARFGDVPAAWRWGEVHQAVFAHPFLRTIPVVGSLTTISIASPGDDDTVDRGGMNTAGQSVHGASFRGVYDLADLNRSLFVMTPGQSGNPFSRHARDFVLRWRDGGSITLGPDAASITGTVRLIP